MKLRIGPKTWEVELAFNAADRTKGLGGIAFLPAGEGMLFDMGMEQHLLMVTTFPMLFSIDVVFLDSKKQVTSIRSSVPPGMVISGIGRYFLEVNAGETEGLLSDGKVKNAEF